jgi:sugar phosphate isomerase/epimerase
MELACALHFSGLQLAFNKQCQLVADAGFAALEVSPWMQGKINNKNKTRLKTLMRKAHLAFSGFTAIYPPYVTLASSSASVRRRNIAYTNRLIELTHDLAGETLVWGSGWARTIPYGTPIRKGYAWLVELLRTCGSFASENQVKIAIEPLNRFESGIIHNMHEALLLADTVDLDSVGTVYDTFQASIEERSFTKPICQAGKRLAAVHVSDCNRKIPGKGHIQFEPIFNMLKRVGYDGYVTLEATLGPDYRKELKAARRFLDKILK